MISDHALDAIRYIGETDDELRNRILSGNDKKYMLRMLLFKLGIKKARTGLSMNFRGGDIRVPGVY